MSPASHRCALESLCKNTVPIAEKWLLLSFLHDRFFDYLLNRFQRLNSTVPVKRHHRRFMRQYIQCKNSKDRCELLSANLEILSAINRDHGIAQRLRASRVCRDSTRRI